MSPGSQAIFASAETFKVSTEFAHEVDRYRQTADANRLHAVVR
jgi:hypothetical protein